MGSDGIISGMSDLGPACAHISVHRVIIRHPGGTQSDVWACDDCHHRFVPVDNTTTASAFREYMQMIATGRSAEQSVSAMLLHDPDIETRGTPR